MVRLTAVMGCPMSCGAARLAISRRARRCGVRGSGPRRGADVRR
ncbi:hypothetical protein [Lysobacter gummosus]